MEHRSNDCAGSNQNQPSQASGVIAFMPPTYLFIGSGQTTMIIERGLTAPRLLVLSLCTIRLLYGSGNDSVDCKTKFLYELLQRR